MRSSTLQNNTATALIREIDSRYDVILEVSKHLLAIEAISSTDFNAIINALNDAKDFTGITVVAGEVAGWDPIGKVITVPTLQGAIGPQGAVGPQGPIGLTGPQGPRGLTGATGERGADGTNGTNGYNGLNGLVPVLEFTIDGSGNLLYEVVGYEEGPTSTDERFKVEEW